MSSSIFRELIHGHPDVCDQILATLVAKVRTLDNRTTEQAHFDVRERLCAELLRLSRTTADGRVIISPPPTDAELAARISTHREAVTKPLNALEREGVFLRTPAAIALMKVERLRQIVAKAAAG
jgi:CRP/FNR family transcriptional regulator, cyclic AMP receptor protein